MQLIARYLLLDDFHFLLALEKIQDHEEGAVQNKRQEQGKSSKVPVEDKQRSISSSSPRLVPWHSIISLHGSLTCYAEHRIGERQRWSLIHDRGGDELRSR